MAFPTRQGTQGLVREECEALQARGHDVHLLCYAAAAYRADFPFRIHRIGNFPRLGSFRSGPLPAKPLLDLRIAIRVRSLLHELLPDVVLAHHVEALAACAVPRIRARLVYHAHAALDRELPTYGLPRAVGRWAGGVEERLVRRADAVVAVSPDLAERFGGVWIPPLVSIGGFPPRSRRPDGVLYQGNLDRYQGMDVLLDAWARVVARRSEVLRIATASAPFDLVDDVARRALSEHVLFEPLGDLASARAALAKAAVVVVPRAVSGGFPIKLVEALAAGAPVVVSRRAAFGLENDVHARIVPDDDPSAMADAILDLLADPDRAAKLGAAGREHVRVRHGAAAIEALERALGVIEPV